MANATSSNPATLGNYNKVAAFSIEVPKASILLPFFLRPVLLNSIIIKGISPSSNSVTVGFIFRLYYYALVSFFAGRGVTFSTLLLFLSTSSISSSLELITSIPSLPFNDLLKLIPLLNNSLN